ncbi:hypothetical protein ACB092_05G145100 [Castanea dentata]
METWVSVKLFSYLISLIIEHSSTILSIRNSISRHVRVRGSIESWLLAEKQIKKCDKIDASKEMDGVLCYYSELAGAVWDERQWEEDMDSGFIASHVVSLVRMACEVLRGTGAQCNEKLNAIFAY